MEQDVRCPNCGTTKYSNVNLKMMVNVCGHSLCESCVEQLFVKGAAKCPTCGVILKKFAYRIQLYDDENVEKDLEFRRRLHKEINLKEDDFDSLKDYNNYLELFETFVYNLANDIDIVETNKQIEQFKIENNAKLKNKKQNKLSKDMELIEQFLEEEKEAKNNRNLIVPKEDMKSAQIIAARRENLLDNLLSSDLPADMIVQSFQKQTEKEIADFNESEAKHQQQIAAALAAKRQQKLQFSSGIRFGVGSNVFEEEDGNTKNALYVYKPIIISNIGLHCPTPRTIVKNHYLNHIRPLSQTDIAGGFSSLYPCQRALQEAIMDLTFLPQNRHQS